VKPQRCRRPFCSRFRDIPKHRLNINRPTRGKEKSPSDGHCQCEKEMDYHLLACQQIFENVPHSVKLLKSEHHFWKVNEINEISFFGMPHCHHYCSANSMFLSLSSLLIKINLQNLRPKLIINLIHFYPSVIAISIQICV
jgi:hypothetical protein